MLNHHQKHHVEPPSTPQAKNIKIQKFNILIIFLKNKRKIHRTPTIAIGMLNHHHHQEHVEHPSRAC
uniref:Ovule protein n=1 Tax=Meloidogyne incognita TaxID=6306 RepID=A0A914KV90_MELIC